MSRFVETNDGWVNLDHVAKIKHWKRGDAYHLELWGPDGEGLGRTREVASGNYFEQILLDLNTPLITAPVGYVLVTVDIDGDGTVDVYEEPVIAWLMTDYGPSVFTLEGRKELHRNMAVKIPDGRLSRYDEGVLYESIEAVVAAAVKEAKEARLKLKVVHPEEGQ